MLKKIRIALAALMFILITLLLLDISGTLHHYLGWMAKIQFLPAVLALNAGVVIALIVITLIFGRIYCSVICPLGVMQDVISWFHSKRKKNRFTYSAEKKWLRYPLLIVFIAAIVAGIGSFVALLAPYSSYGRIVVNLFKPIYETGNNLLASIAEHFNSYAFYHVDTWIKSIPTLIIAAVTFVIIAILAWRGGRTYCNTICPVGTFLSFFSRFSLLKIHFDEEKCKNCSLCTKNCKASCIDYKNHTVDHSRCVTCGNCIQPWLKRRRRWMAVWLPLKRRKRHSVPQLSHPRDPSPQRICRNTVRRVSSAFLLVLTRFFVHQRVCSP